MDVGIWLRGLALGQYESPLAENETGGEVRPNSLPDPLELRLKEALEREAATAEIFRVIANSVSYTHLTLPTILRV